MRADWLAGRNGWTCHVEQGNYGHAARKATWLYVRSHQRPDDLRWGPSTARAWRSPGTSLLNARGKVVETMSKRQRSATPPAFRDVLLAIARSTRLHGATP